MCERFPAFEIPFHNNSLHRFSVLIDLMKNYLR